MTRLPLLAMPALVAVLSLSPAYAQAPGATIGENFEDSAAAVARLALGTSGKCPGAR